MSQKFYRAQKVALAVSSALAMGTASAADTYEILNIDEVTGFTVNGTLDNTQNGYGIGFVPGDQVMLGTAKGVNDSTSFDDNVVDDVIDAILPVQGNAANSIVRPFSGNNFLFELGGVDGSVAEYVPLLENKQPIINPTIDPYEDDLDLVENTPKTDAYYYSAGNEKFGARLGIISALQQTVENPFYDGGTSTSNTPVYYYRDFETRGFIQKGNVADPQEGIDYVLLPPSDSSDFYTPDEDSTFTDPVKVGGYSVASKVSEDIDGSNAYVAGYASIAITENTIDDLQDCVDDLTDDVPEPIEACVQNLQNGGFVNYQNRAFRWTVNLADMEVTASEALPLGFVPDDIDDVYVSQGLGVNSAGYVVGRGYRSEDGLDEKPDLIDGDLWATFWTPDNEIYFVGPTVDDKDEYSESILEDVNEQGIAVGTLRQYIDGDQRQKFAYVDITQPADENRELQFIEPNDFSDTQTDLSSRARDINDANQIVGYIEVDLQDQLPRRVHGFLYNIDNDEFNNINELLTCRSRGLEDQGDGNYAAYTVTDTTSFAEEVTYDTAVSVVDANQISADGEFIAATALVTLPRIKTEEVELYDEDGDYQGDYEVIVVGDNGRPVVERTADGEIATDQVPRAVILRRSDATACPVEVISGLNPEKNERQGASFGWGWLLALAPVAWLRRRRS
ncbi:DUF3466 family protein [Ferrimonas lipolytica]|uniref:DUF3466 family protein n=1 Tax=Ferrimonas lipolytica TaxID=2724191 RepID=A0A6H1UBY2_9GAMM|nr:DUF3466 family protein [Ferrimonas lipolytica]QIZ76571.1 DUF3466 family protein [Ferrimonas lipolytica]